MKIFGIDFIPLNVPLKNRLEALSAGIFLVLTVGLLFIGVVFLIYMLFFSSYWYLFCVYLFYIWVVDKKTPEAGGRRSEWVRSWTLFKYFKNYFPITVDTVPEFYLDPNKNYLACCFPHGFMPFGVMATTLTNAFDETKVIFRNHKVYGTTLHTNYYIPLYRELLLALGICSVTPKSISWLLDSSTGGRVTGIFVGGAAEAHFCHKGQYELVLKNRKGYAKLALKNGTSIIPVFSFGQNNNYDQLVFKEGSFLKLLQTKLKEWTRISLLLINGRGLFQNTFGIIPLQKPINVVFGTPIDVEKIEKPTQEDIDALHSRFIEKLTELFEQYKYKYEENPEQVSLILV